MTEHPLLLSTRDVCDRLHLSHSAVLRLVQIGRLHPFQVGSKRPLFAFPIEGILAITEASTQEVRNTLLASHRERRRIKEKHWHDQARLIISLVCQYMHLPSNRLRYMNHHAKITRDICVWLMREIPIPPISYPVIGFILCRDHSTCISAYQRITLRPGLLASMTSLREQVEKALRREQEQEAKTTVLMSPGMPQDGVLAVEAGVDVR